MSKSRSERKTPAQAQPPPVPISNDVVPGRFTESDWSHLLEEETEEDFVTDILQDVVSNALDAIYNKLIESRVIPYTVNAAKELMLDVIEWQFLVNDLGENDVSEDKTWLEDEEPESGVTDSWAQGIVPVMSKKEDVLVEEADELEENANITEAKGDEVKNEENATIVGSSDQFIEENPITDDRIETTKDDVSNVVKEKSAEKPEKKKATKPAKTTKQAEKPFKPYRGRVPSFKSISMTPVTDERPKPGQYLPNQTMSGNETGFFMSSDSLMKANNGRPPGTRDVTYDFKGNVVHVHKLNMERLPSHRVKTRFAVVDPLEEAFQAKLANKKQRYNLLRNDDRAVQKVDNQINSTNRAAKEKDMKLVSPLPPPLVDTIDVSAGVVIKEKGVVKRGLRQPLNQYYTNDATQLQPLGSTHSGPSLNVQGMFSEGKPIVKPLHSSRPLPAIPVRGNYY